MATTTTFNISEVLCFVFNKYGKLKRLQLKSTLQSYYAEDELIEAKDRLHTDASNLQLTDLPHNRTRAKGDNRSKFVADDILDLCTFLDEKGCLGNLPSYLAQNLDHVPLVKSENLELFCVAKKIEDMEKRLATVESLNIENLVAKFENVSTRLYSQQDSISKAASDLVSLSTLVNNEQLAVNNASDQASAGSMVSEQSSSWVDVAVAPSNSAPEQKWTIVSRQKPKSTPKLSVRVHGVKVSESSTIRSVPRKPILAAYVGRLMV